MAFDSSKLTLGTRGTLTDFILHEEKWSRSVVPVKVGSYIQPGDLVDDTGKKITNKIDAGDVFGIALTAYNDMLFSGLTREGDIKIAVLRLDAEVKDTIFMHNGISFADRKEFILALGQFGISVVPSAVDAAF